MPNFEYKGILITYSPDDAKETGFGWYATKLDGSWATSPLFKTREQVINAINTNQILWRGDNEEGSS
jgi:hypothetical protein